MIELINIKEVSFGKRTYIYNYKTNNFLQSLTIKLHNNVVCTKYLLKIKIYHHKTKIIQFCNFHTLLKLRCC